MMAERDTSEPAPEPARRRKFGRRTVFLSAFLLLLGGLILGNWFAGQPKTLGVTDGRLANCPDSPNCVCSQDAREPHHIAALTYDGQGQAALARLAKVIESWPRTKIITQTNNYMHVEFTTRILRFVDDVEFLLAENENVIHVRSASRVGHTDMGTNRKRVEALREEFAAERRD